MKEITNNKNIQNIQSDINWNIIENFLFLIFAMKRNTTRLGQDLVFSVNPN